MKKLLAVLLAALCATYALTSVSSARPSSGRSVSSVQAAQLAANSPVTIRVVNANLLQGLWNAPKDLQPGLAEFDNRNVLKYLNSLTKGTEVFALSNLDWRNVDNTDRMKTCEQTRDYLTSVKPNTSATYASFWNSTKGGSCIIWRSDKFTKVDQAPANFGNRGENDVADSDTEDCSGASREDMNSVGVRLKRIGAAASNRSLSIASVHLGDCKWQNITDIRNWVNAVPGPKLILGDFNVSHDPGTVHDQVVNVLVGSGAERGYTELKTWTSWPAGVDASGAYPAGPTDRFGGFDYWFYRDATNGTGTVLDKDCRGTPCKVVTNKPYSDHHGGFANITYTP